MYTMICTALNTLHSPIETMVSLISPSILLASQAMPDDVSQTVILVLTAAEDALLKAFEIFKTISFIILLAFKDQTGN